MKKSFIEAIMININPIFDRNIETIRKYNRDILPMTFVVAMITILLPMIFSMFRPSMLETLPAYLAIFIMIGILLGLSYIKRLNKYPLNFAYIFGFIIFLLSSYLSLIRFSDRPAGTMLIYLVVSPLIFIDRSIRMNIYIVSLFILHFALSMYFKDLNLTIIDLINTSIASLLGILFGRIFLVNRLMRIDVENQLRVEKETDYLTGLNNRRKLYDDLDLLKQMQAQNIGMMMLDIDYFKEFNDKYGHIQGDLCLVSLGKILSNLSDKSKIKFYRFGGEEFIGITKEVPMNELIKLAEKIRMRVNEINFMDSKITISIGLSFTKGIQEHTIDKYIDKADKALYQAKKLGRNKIEINKQ